MFYSSVYVYLKKTHTQLNKETFDEMSPSQVI